MWGFFALISLLLLAFIGYAQLLSYLQGESFREALENVLARSTQASTAEITGTLSIDANRVSLQGIDLQRDDRLQQLRAGNVHAELVRSALWDHELHLTRLMAEEGALLLDLDREGRELFPARRKASGFLARLAPTRARLERLDCKDFNTTLRFGGQDYTLTDSSLSASPTPRRGNKAWEFRLSNGRVHTPLPLIGDSSLKNATLTLGDKVATLSDARLMLSPGELIVNAVREHADGDWSADIRANSVDVSRLIGPDWKKRLTGVLYGRLQADGHAGGMAQAEGRLSLQQGVLEALPFLSNLPAGNSYPYRSLRVEKATARLSYPYTDAARNIQQAWLLDQIDLRSEGGWLRLQGHALVDADGTLSGTLLIGLPENIAASLAPADSPLLSSIFNARGEAGYLWLRLNLSGSLSAPQEDLSVRLRTLISSALPEAVGSLRELLLPTKAETPAPTEDAAAPSPTPAPAQLLQGAGKAAGELIGSGLRSLF